MRLIILPVAILALLILVAIPLFVAFVSVAGVLTPWLVFGLLLWAVFAAGRPPRRERWGRPRWQPRPVAPARPTPRGPGHPTPPPATRLAPRPELPIDVQVKIEQIRRKAQALEGYAEHFPPFSKDLYLVRQTTNEYLPRTVEAYLALPPVGADRVLPASGKTALQELKDQLDLLDSKLNEIAEDLQRRDVDRLLANRRFLEERFGRGA